MDPVKEVVMVPFWYWNEPSSFYIDYDAALDRYYIYTEDGNGK